MLRTVVAVAGLTVSLAAEMPLLEKEDIFPFEKKHNHASSIVELPNGDFFVCWYRGSGEREADDVQVMASRKSKSAQTWTTPYVLADTPGFPDTNPMLFLDRRQRLWLFWQAIVANRWETAITKMRTTARWQTDPIRWDDSDILLIKPRNFEERVGKDRAGDKFAQRMGWMTRAHATQLAGGRILLPLYSDGYSFSLVAISDDDGATWMASEPIVGRGNIQPSIAARKDGTLVAYMRDNGPQPKRVHISYSKDSGLTWTPAEHTDIPNPGAGLEVVVLKDGRWVFINNDLERQRYSLAVWMSDDEGETWKWKRHLELDQAGSFHYPSILQARDGSLHVSYSVFVKAGQAIRHARFTPEWIMEGDK